MKSISRRGFLRTGIAGAGMVAVSPVLMSAASSFQENNIIYRTLGKTGIKVPVISFGVMRSDNSSLCKAAYDKGIRFFDTAHGYQDGNNEMMLGNLFKDYRRDSFILATKVKAETGRDGKPSDQTSPDKFLELFNSSLSRLKMDYVDILYVHGVNNPEMLEYKPIVATIKKLKKDGKIRFMGFSTHKNEPALISAAADMDTWDVILTTYNYKLAYLDKINEAIKKAASAGIGIVAMKTMAGGGWLDKEKTRPMNTAAALKWVLSNPDVHTTIPGMTSFDQLELNLPLLTDITLTDKEKSDLLADNSVPGLFCSGCKQCIPACPNNLPVPELMRAYMYAYGYSMPSKARTLLGELGTNSDPCSNCNECSVNCSRDFRIREKITDVSRLVNVSPDFLA
ncbi:MAG: aldo/keto reductase [Bacteroidales bacterium]|jgi:predicted aldo/keto reductase-like oxidoreductase|nr:aldo/keto reductase [Bacteroidales bacterium]